MHPTFTFKARIRKKNIHLDTMEKYGVFRKTKRKQGKRIWKKISTMKKHQTIVVCRRKSTSGGKKVLYKGTDTSYCYKVTLSSRSNLTHTNSNLIYLVPKHFKKLFLLSLCDTTWVKLWVEICIAIKTIKSVLFRLKNSFRPKKLFAEIKFASF